MTIDWDDQPLGEIPDAELARRLDVSQPTVFEARERRGIAPAAPPGHDSGIDWDQVDWEKNNSELGRELGVSRQAVAYQRKRRQ